MNRKTAFARLGVPNIHRRQWNAKNEDGVEVLSVWDFYMTGDEAEAHVHKKDYDAFTPGMNVRVVVQRGEQDPETKTMRTLEAYPEGSEWTVLGKEVRPHDHPNHHVLHVVRIRRDDTRPVRVSE